MNGGAIVAQVLKTQGVRFVFTLVGGHISPILVVAKRLGIRVVDTRHEATAVFAADAVARLTGVPGVAAVTAGPGVTNTITAVKNAQMAQSPLVLIGGAAATALQGRGALQDIDQLSLVRSVVKWARSVRRAKELAPTLQEAFRQAQEGVPGPVFVECPVDLLYDEAVVRQWYGLKASGGGSPAQRATQTYLKWHVRRLFSGVEPPSGERIAVPPPEPDAALVQQAARRLLAAERPVILVGSQALLDAPRAPEVAAAVARIGAPVYLSGMARGLLGRNHPLQMRHQRRAALKEADLVLLAGVPCDFRLDYGAHIRRSAAYIAANRSAEEMRRNRRPTLAVQGDPGRFLTALAAAMPAQDGGRWAGWCAALRGRDDARTAEIARQAAEPMAAQGAINPLHLCAELDRQIRPNTILVADGGDFVATAAYTVQPPGPLSWLDPGAFGTLGVGAGFALGAALCRPGSDVWIIYGDGSAGYSLAEFDTFVRHGVRVAAVVGNDAGWSQIARDQVEMLHDDVATVLAHSDYQRVAEAFGGTGWRLDDPELVEETLGQARAAAASGAPALVNAILAKSDFRKGSLSM